MRRPRLPFLVAAAASLIGGCLNDAGPAKREINWRLSDSLKAFDSVLILIADPSGNPLDTVHRGKLDNPFALPPYPVPAAVPAAFRVNILGLSAAGDTQYFSVVRVEAGRVVPPTPFRSLLLDSLRVSAGIFLQNLSAVVSDFSSLEPEYVLTGLAAADSLSVTAHPVDTASVDLSLDGYPLQPGIPSGPRPLQSGSNFFELRVSARDGSGWTRLRIRADR